MSCWVTNHTLRSAGVDPAGPAAQDLRELRMLYDSCGGAPTVDVTDGWSSSVEMSVSYDLLIPKDGLPEGSQSIIGQFHGRPDARIFLAPNGTTGSGVDKQRTFAKGSVVHFPTAAAARLCANASRRYGNCFSGDLLAPSGDPSGWLYQSGGFPPLVFGYDPVSKWFYVEGRSDDREFKMTHTKADCHFHWPIDYLNKRHCADAPHEAVQGLWRQPRSEFAFDEWLRFDWIVRWSSFSNAGYGSHRNGSVQLSIGGSKVIDWTGPIGRNDGGRLPYFKIGVYNPSGIPGKTQVFFRNYSQSWKSDDTLLDVRSFGAKPDGITDNSLAFARALKACNCTGGCTLRVPQSLGYSPSRYMLRYLRLVSNVVLELEADIVAPAHLDEWAPEPIVTISNVRNVTVRGPGGIDGRANHNGIWNYTCLNPRHALGGCLIGVQNATDVHLCCGLSIRNAPSWHVQADLLQCVDCDEGGLVMEDITVAAEDAVSQGANGPSSCLQRGDTPASHVENYSPVVWKTCTGYPHARKSDDVVKDTRKGVVFMVMDDARPLMNHAYGQSFMKTPNFDRLSREAMVFRHAYCQYAVCGPSRNSFMTGRRESQRTPRCSFPARTTSTHICALMPGPDTVKVYNFLTKCVKHARSTYESIQLTLIVVYTASGTPGRSG
jgi:hypothetical protein